MSSQPIIHPTDFLSDSKAALKFASILARHLQAKLLIVHVASPVGSPLAAGGVGAGFPIMGTVPDPTSTSALPKEHEALRDDLLAISPTEANVEYHHLLLEGAPATEIVKAAERLNASQIVMGSHGRSGLARVLVGSVAESVLREAPCPVTVVRAQKNFGDSQ